MSWYNIARFSIDLKVYVDLELSQVEKRCFRFRFFLTVTLRKPEYPPTEL